MAKVHFVTAHFGGNLPWLQSVTSLRHQITFANYTDKNTPSRALAFHPRMKSKIPKMLEWLYVDADWYVWMDSSVRLTADDAADYLLDVAGKNPLCLFKASTRSSIREEANVVRQSISNQHDYITKRYLGEPILEQLVHYYGDPAFVDNKLFAMTFFAYHKTAIPLMREWFLHNAAWSLQDQISFPYVLSKTSLSYSLIPGQVDGSNPLFEWDWRSREQNLASPN